MRPLRVLVLMHPDFIPPDSAKGYTPQEINVWKTEYDVVSTLRAAGHEVRALGVQEELKPIREAIEEFKPHVAFNLLEQFHGETIYDHNVASYLELMKVPYSGCNPRGLMLARGKDLSKTLVHHHRIPVPAFAVFPMRQKVKRPKRLPLPLFVKSLTEDGSRGISQASVVETDEKLVERVAFVHEKIGTAAIVEQYIEGRELYVGVLGNARLKRSRCGSSNSARWPRVRATSRRRRSNTTRTIRRSPASWTDRRRICRRNWPRGCSGSPSASTARSSSTDTRASTSASRRTARRISSRRTPTPKLRRARNSRLLPSLSGSSIRHC
jgi:hypothetical protein